MNIFNFLKKKPATTLSGAISSHQLAKFLLAHEDCGLAMHVSNDITAETPGVHEVSFVAGVDGIVEPTVLLSRRTTEQCMQYMDPAQ